MAEALDAVFDRCPKLSAELTVWRGVGHRPFLEEVKPGYQFRSLEFWSTSPVRARAGTFIRETGALMQLDLPAGFPVYNMETLEGAGGGEKEFLLPRGVMWELVSAPLIPPGELPGLLRAKAPKIPLLHLKAMVGPRPLK
ncbi:hypothetical protein [Caulobacter sp. FWC26]|uniref:hypothetical protein n=1 Tax=Caulobacter sp. FWC26 TaxID=69665 RepID=UPI000C577672|nr:hypothetical protein [Caulobacter sp. FWC26]